ncbi:MAG: GNAT family N-acetyltransferase [Pseudomonadota bacterium]
MGEIVLRKLTGADFKRALDGLARLRIEIFREWPYLYDGDLDYERRYLSKFAMSKDAVIIGAYDGDKLVGAATASPLIDHADEFASPFRKAGLDPEEFFYFAEFLMLKPHRRQGIGARFFDEMEQVAQDAGFHKIAFCTVVRPADHPAKPDDAIPIDGFCRRHGYRPVDGLICDFPWRDLGDAEETHKPMQVWVREFTAAAQPPAQPQSKS